MLTSLQSRAVGAIKRHAAWSTRKSAAGSAFFLRVYLEAEEQAEQPLLDELLGDLTLPLWLRRQLERHQRDEARHARMLRGRLEELGQTPGSFGGRFDAVGRWKLARLRTLIERTAASFSEGKLVPVLAVAWRMEAMGHRVLARHRDSIEPGDPTFALVSRIAAEELGHAKGCKRALDKLTRPEEAAALETLVAEIDAIDRAFGITSAVAMWIGAHASAAAAGLDTLRRRAS